jgi:hypothetical protein
MQTRKEKLNCDESAMIVAIVISIHSSINIGRNSNRDINRKTHTLVGSKFGIAVTETYGLKL